MKSEDLQFYGNNPGAVKFGNFINYYSFHNAKQRIDCLNPDMFPSSSAIKPYVCLDIGCNTGELTFELLQYLQEIFPSKEIHILGIDIDPSLIERAQELYGDVTNISFIACDIMSEQGHQNIQNKLDKFGVQHFNVTFCFSVTMWIHLNYGDEGLIEFLKFIRNNSRCIILELQPWKCYRSALRRVTKTGNTFPLYKTLKIRSDITAFIESSLSSKIQENIFKNVHESKSYAWNRKIISFQRVE